MVRTNQGGSILGFVIIGVVMALLLIGGVYFVRNNLGSLVGNETPGVVDEGSESEEDATDTEDDEANQPGEDENTVDEGQEFDTTDPDESTDDTEGSTDNQVDENQPTGENTSPDNLPETGPADMVAAGLLLSGLVGAAVAYLRSRG